MLWTLRKILSKVILIGAMHFLSSCAQAAERPNILFILTDDQAPWALSSSGYSQARTPHLDLLFSQGARFTHSFTVTPVCSPSRASLMTSRYGTELGITDWINPRTESTVGLDPATVLWPEVLQEAGYQTCLVGKWHLGTEDKFHPILNGFDTFFGFREGGAKVESPILETAGDQHIVPGSWEKGIHQEGVIGATAEYPGLTVDTLTDYAVDYLGGVRKGKDPFLLCVHYRSPHSPWLPTAPEDWAPYENMDPEIPNPDYPDLDTEKVKEKTREYLASVAGVDRNVGRILEKLEKEGLGNNTVIVFTSDHGYNMGHNGIWHKGNGHWITRAVRDLEGGDPRRQRPNLYDNSLLVPTTVRWPGHIEPGTVVEETVTNLDWYPTLLAMTGVPQPEGVRIRGRNILPLLEGEAADWENDLYAQYSQHHYADTHMRTYRTPEYKLIRDFKREGKDEFYDLRKDPTESSNLIEDSEYTEIIAKLDGLLRQEMAQIGDNLAK